MRSLLIGLFAVLIALTSIAIEVPSFDFSDTKITSIQTEPTWQSDFLLNPGKKLSGKTHIIAENFIPMVLIADELDADQLFYHYLSFFKLHQIKEFFLLL